MIASLRNAMSKPSLVILTIFITAAGTSVLWMAMGVLAYKFWWNADGWNHEDLFMVELDAPQLVEVGETFTLTVRATNIDDGPLRLNSIDIYDGFLDGFEVVRIFPEPSDESAVWEYRAYYFNGLRLAPGESASVSYEFKAVKPGMWHGDVDCCTPSESFSTATAVIMVVEGAHH